jgi:hypothetical protein
MLPDPMPNAPLLPSSAVLAPSTRVAWLEDDPVTAIPCNVTRIMSMGGFALAEAMIEEALALAQMELIIGDQLLFPPGGHSHDTIYEANLRRIKALRLTLDTLRRAHHHLPLPR